ncbi:hypothetical protein C8Q80DRAFT_1159161 [Daedaleopsis nitida]|nr:hypothetical protein C8Q80DRAFT_1159161 [Daedaleopsis nitida]
MRAICPFQVVFPKWSLGTLLRCFLQILEGVEFLHDMKIAHLDFVPDNLLLATQWDVDTHPGVPIEAGKVYIIDIGESQ